MSESVLTETDIYTAIREIDKRVVTANALAEQLGYTRQHLDLKLRELETDSGLKSVDVGPCKGWYLEPDYRPAMLLVDEFEGAQLASTAYLDCEACHHVFESGDMVGVLFEEAERGWLTGYWLCEHHLHDPDAETSRERLSAMNRQKYVEKSSDSYSFAVVSGTAQVSGDEDNLRGEVTLHDVEIHEYLPGTRATETRWDYLDE